MTDIKDLLAKISVDNDLGYDDNRISQIINYYGGDNKRMLSEISSKYKLGYDNDAISALLENNGSQISTNEEIPNKETEAPPEETITPDQAQILAKRYERLPQEEKTFIDLKEKGLISNSIDYATFQKEIVRDPKLLERIKKRGANNGFDVESLEGLKPSEEKREEVLSELNPDKNPFKSIPKKAEATARQVVGNTFLGIARLNQQTTKLSQSILDAIGVTNEDEKAMLGIADLQVMEAATFNAEQQQKAEKLSKQVIDRVDEVDNPADFLSLVTNTVVEIVPQAAAAIGTFGLSSAIQETGSIYYDQLLQIAEDEGKTIDEIIKSGKDGNGSEIAFGALAGALDRIGAGYVLKNKQVKNFITASLNAYTRKFLGIAGGALGEGVTEGLQTGVEQIGSAVGAGRGALENIDLREIGEATVLGSIGGGTTKGASVLAGEASNQLNIRSTKKELNDLNEGDVVKVDGVEYVKHSAPYLVSKDEDVESIKIDEINGSEEIEILTSEEANTTDSGELPIDSDEQGSADTEDVSNSEDSQGRDQVENAEQGEVVLEDQVVEDEVVLDDQVVQDEVVENEVVENEVVEGEVVEGEVVEGEVVEGDRVTEDEVVENDRVTEEETKKTSAPQEGVLGDESKKLRDSFIVEESDVENPISELREAAKETTSNGKPRLSVNQIFERFRKATEGKGEDTNVDSNLDLGVLQASRPGAVTWKRSSLIGLSDAEIKELKKDGLKIDEENGTSLDTFAIELADQYQNGQGAEDIAATLIEQIRLGRQRHRDAVIDYIDGFQTQEAEGFSEERLQFEADQDRESLDPGQQRNLEDILEAYADKDGELDRDRLAKDYNDGKFENIDDALKIIIVSEAIKNSTSRNTTVPKKALTGKKKESATTKSNIPKRGKVDDVGEGLAGIAKKNPRLYEVINRKGAVDDAVREIDEEGGVDNAIPGLLTPYKGSQNNDSFYMTQAKRIVAIVSLGKRLKEAKEIGDTKAMDAIDDTITKLIAATQEDSTDAAKGLGMMELLQTLTPEMQVVRIVRTGERHNESVVYDDGGDISKVKKELESVKNKLAEEISKNKEISKAISKVAKGDDSKKARIKRKRENLFDKLKTLKEQKGSLGISGDSQAKRDAEMAATQIKIARTFIDEGIVNFTELVDKLVKEFRQSGVFLKVKDAKNIAEEALGGAIWPQYKKEAANKLSEALLDKKGKKGKKSPPLKEFTDRLERTIRSQLDPKKKKGTPNDIVKEVLSNLDKYRDVIIETADAISEEYELDQSDAAEAFRELFAIPFFKNKAAPKLVNDGLKSVAVDIPFLIKNYDGPISKIADHLTKELRTKYGLSKEDSAIIVTAVEKFINQKYDDAAARAIRKTGVTKKSIIDKLMDIYKSNGDIELKDLLIEEALVKHFNLVNVSAQDKRNMKELFVALNETEGAIQDVILNTIGKEIVKFQPPRSTSDAIVSAWIALNYAQMLSGPTTDLVNIGSNAFNNILNPLLDVLNITEHVKNMREGRGWTMNLQRAIVNFMTLNSRREIAADKAVNIFKRGIVNDNVKFIEGLKKGETSVSELEIEKFNGHRFIGGKYNPHNLLKYVTRKLAAQDAFFTSMNLEREFLNHIIKAKAKSGLRGKELRDAALSTYYGSKITDEQKDAIDAKVRKEVAILKESTGKKATQREINQRTRDEMVKTLGFKPETIDEAIDAARTDTFTNEGSGSMSQVASMISNLVNKNKYTQIGFKGFFMFTKVLGNIGDFMLNTLPFYGFVRPSMGGSVTHLINLARKQVGGEPRGDARRGAKGSPARIKQYGQAWLGTLTYLMIAPMLTVEPLDGDSDEEEWGERQGLWLSGGRSTDPNYRRNTKRVIPAYTLMNGTTPVFTYTNIPLLAIPLSVIGEYNDAIMGGMKIEDVGDRLYLAGLSNFRSLNVISNMSVVTGLTQFSSLLTELSELFNREQEGIGFKVDTGNNNGSINPVVKALFRNYSGLLLRPMLQNNNAIRQIAKFFDPTSYKQPDIEAVLWYNLNLHYFNNNINIDIFGDEIRSLPGSQALTIDQYIEGDHPMKDVMFKMALKKATPKSPINRSNFVIDGIARRATNDEFEDYSRLSGAYFKESILDYIYSEEGINDFEDGERLHTTKSGKTEYTNFQKRVHEMHLEAQSKAREELWDM